MSNNLRDHWDWSLIRKRCTLEAARIMRRPHDVEEVVQEALTRAWRARGTCRTPDAPIPWCLQITRNEAFRLIGRQQALSRGEPLDASHEIEDERAQVERERALTRADVVRALEELTPQDRLLISLRYEHDCSHPDIATKLQIPEATARVRLHRAHQRLKPLLESSS